ncbi:MAG: cytochrome c3 family protein [Bacteroidetes bacterium]|nr:cytochrome c3 family protein [Bacteroidota bacterium]GIK41474.1 MAG: hypothetical protein BroJett011_53070 [Chloroflexota bacterium]
MINAQWLKVTILSILCLIGIWAGSVWLNRLNQAVNPLAQIAPAQAAGGYVVLAWNDLGMHCYNRDFKDLAVLPPFNTLWAQVIKAGDPPYIITSGITVTYVFTDNTYSVGKSNFWDYDVPLFGVNLPPNIGLKGKGLAGQMDLSGDHFIAEGIPLTEFRDSAPTTAYPYQLAIVIVQDAATGAELARTITVAPLSTEMHCDTCHHDYGQEGIATGSVERNILVLHDQEAGTHLDSSRPVLCASCHASNALGTTGSPGVPNLSKAMHAKHAEEGLPSTLAGCYNCHPGPKTQCLRDVMSQKGMTCSNCHSTLQTVSQNPAPWLNEPRCDNSGCHGSSYQQDQALYRNSKGHGAIYCAGCHDSPHAIAQSREPNDAIKFIGWQGHPGTLATCTVCHATQPSEGGPHTFVVRARIYLPVILRQH